MKKAIIGIILLFCLIVGVEVGIEIEKKKEKTHNSMTEIADNIISGEEKRERVKKEDFDKYYVYIFISGEPVGYYKTIGEPKNGFSEESMEKGPKDEGFSLTTLEGEKIKIGGENS